MRTLAPVLAIILTAGCGQDADTQARLKAEAAGRAAAEEAHASSLIAAGATVLSSTAIPEGRITALSVPTGYDGLSIEQRKCVLFTGPTGASIDCKDTSDLYMDEADYMPADDGENQFGRY